MEQSFVVMNLEKKFMKRIYWIWIVFLFGCKFKELPLVKLEGKTMGTTYHVSFLSPDHFNPEKVQAEIDSLLVCFNRSVSTYIPTSTISRVNKTDTLIEVDDYFIQVFTKAQEVSEKTNGAFDITIMPLVNAWGFGYTDTIRMDHQTVDSLRLLVDYRKVNLVKANGIHYIHKKDNRIQVDFSAIAKGYGVDLVSQLLEKKGVENYMVEIGGEIRAKGKNAKNKWWQIGIEKPVDDAGGNHTGLEKILNLDNHALATSGNYRNFYYRNGKKVSHEINPATGYPAENNLLSVSVIAKDCMTADAYATAFMVMGMEKTLSYLQSDTTLHTCLIFAGDKGEMKTFLTKGMTPFISKNK